MLPKPAAERRRRNKPKSKPVVMPKTVTDAKVPGLSSDFEWHKMTLLWWRDVWQSPMAKEWAKADRHTLYRCAALVNDFWESHSSTTRVRLSSEIARLQRLFGLSPLDRRRLEWSFEDEDDSKVEGFEGPSIDDYQRRLA